MADRNLTHGRSSRSNRTPANTGRVSREAREEQYLHLVRLAWDLNKLGLRAAVDLPLKTEPVLVIPRSAGALKIMAVNRKGTWVFSWGRGEGQRVRALADDTATRVWEVAQ